MQLSPRFRSVARLSGSPSSLDSSEAMAAEYLASAASTPDFVSLDEEAASDEAGDPSEVESSVPPVDCSWTDEDDLLAKMDASEGSIMERAMMTANATTTISMVRLLRALRTSAGAGLGLERPLGEAPLPARPLAAGPPPSMGATRARARRLFCLDELEPFCAIACRPFVESRREGAGGASVPTDVGAHGCPFYRNSPTPAVPHQNRHTAGQGGRAWPQALGSGPSQTTSGGRRARGGRRRASPRPRRRPVPARGPRAEGRWGRYGCWCRADRAHRARWRLQA